MTDVTDGTVGLSPYGWYCEELGILLEGQTHTAPPARPPWPSSVARCLFGKGGPFLPLARWPDLVPGRCEVSRWPAGAGRIRPLGEGGEEPRFSCPWLEGPVAPHALRKEGAM